MAGLGAVDDAEIWSARREMREQLVEEARRRIAASWLERGASAAELGWVEEVLDPDVLTIGFARRVPTYKRLTLMLRDPQRLTELLLDEERPIQLLIAGKSHPADDLGKRLIQQLVQFADDPRVRHRIAFLPNYDIEMAQVLYPGCDVWLNNPLRPLEACGTSGMKAALNGGLNLSILDGWWDEWYDHHNEPARRSGGRRVVRTDRQAGGAGLLRPRRGGRAATLDGDGQAHVGHPGPEGAGHPDGARLRRAALRSGRHGGSHGRRRRLRPGP
jgi:alpha-glucan phosphorylase-like protein